jgi:hypothetical protein
MASYLKNRLLYKYLPSLSTFFKCFYSKIPIIADLKLFRNKYYIHIQDEERSCGSKHLPPNYKVIIIGYTAFPKVYEIFTLENKDIFMTQDLTFPI